MEEEKKEKRISWFHVLAWTLDTEKFNEGRSTKTEDIEYLGKTESYFLGILMTLLATTILWALSVNVLEYGDINTLFVNGILYTTYFILCIIVVFNQNIHEIEAAHGAVPEVLDTRLKGVVLREGKYWIFPGIITLQVVNMKVQFSNTHPSEVLDADNLDWDVDGEITWIVDNPFIRLETAEEDIEEVVLHAAADSILDVFRSRKSDEVFSLEGRDGSEQKNELADAVRDSLHKEINHVGASCKRVYFNKVLPDQRYLDAKRRAPIEKAERAAEKIEMAHVANEIKKLAKKTQLSIEDSRDVFQTERGKVNKEIRENRISLDKGTQEAAAAVAKILKGGD